MSFHSRNGLHFERLADGTVRIFLLRAGERTPLVELPENEWASVVASVSAGGEDGPRWQAARIFHGLGE